MTQRDPIEDARQLRAKQTKAEALLWELLRAKQLCGLKFRRQHPQPPFVLDFACLANRFAVEVDGGYHDLQFEKDQQRETFLIHHGWKIIRFSNEDILKDVESIAIAITRHLGLEYRFTKRHGGSSNLVLRQRLEKDKTLRRKRQTPLPTKLGEVGRGD